MQKVEINDPGETGFLQGDRINRFDFVSRNLEMKNHTKITNPGDSDYEAGDVVLKENVK